jgi:hypothetical protein
MNNKFNRETGGALCPKGMGFLAACLVFVILVLPARAGEPLLSPAM